MAQCFFDLQGKPIDFAEVDEGTARWVQDFNVKPYATPAKLESIDGENICKTLRVIEILISVAVALSCVIMTVFRCPIPGAAHPRLSCSRE